MQNHLIDPDIIDITSVSLSRGVDFALIPSTSVTRLWSKKQISSQIWRSIQTVLQGGDLSGEDNNHWAAGNALNTLLGISSQKSPQFNYSCLIIFLSDLTKVFESRG